MAKEYYTVLTDIGAAKMAAAVTTGKKVVITEFAVGDGFGTKYSPSQEQTALKNEVYRGQIDDYSTEKNKIKVSGIIPAEVGGFTVREAGAFDDEGDLIAITNLAETEKPYPFDGITYQLQINITITVTTAQFPAIEVDSISTKKMREMVNNAKREIYNLLARPGKIDVYAGNGEPPFGFLLCNGAEISRLTYADLFAAIGTSYGEGDGVNTFNLPDLTARFIMGDTVAGQIKEAGLPNITAGVGYVNNYYPYGNTTGAFEGKDGEVYTQNAVNPAIETSCPGYPYLTFDASKSNSIYGASDTVQPPALTMRYIIKY